jgi:parallel beta-helix repeat protein
MTGSTRNTVSGCRITGNDLAGISLYGSAGNTFSNNLFKNEKNVAVHQRQDAGQHLERREA